jgi:short-subunit dehydrogenase
MGVAVVTGASAGVGRATAVALARRGYDVALLARGEAGLEAACRDVEATGRRALAIPTDVGDAAQVDAAATRTEVELGEIDVWVNNAMTTVFAWFPDVTAEEFARATSVTYLGQVYGTMSALRRMRPRDRGRIVNVGSALAFVGIPLQAAYCGAKFAIRGFTESVRAELLHEGSQVTVSLVHLPAVNPPQFGWCRSKMPKKPKPVPPVYQPEVAARAIVESALDGKRSRIVGSWNTALVGAAEFAPAVVAQYAARTAVDSQQTGEPAEADRASNLCAAVDDDRDAGAHGEFGDQAQGVRDRSFLRSLPRTLADLAQSVRAAARG